MVCETHSGFKFLVDVVMHFMTTNTERFCISHFQRGIETTPEYHTSHKPTDAQCTEAEMNRRTTKSAPKAFQHRYQTRHNGPPLSELFSFRNGE
jgi:hypothetical protein